MGYDVSIEENGRTGRKPLHWEYLEDEDRKYLVSVYSKLINLRTQVPQLFDTDSSFKWEVSVSDWDGCRNISIESIDGKKLFIVGNFTTESKTSSAAIPSGWDEYYNFVTGEKMENVGGVNPTIQAHSFTIYSNFNNMK